MRTGHKLLGGLLGSALMLGSGGAARADQLPGMGLLAGKVTVAKPLGVLTVYAFNTDKNVGYMVYVVNGEYRATNLFPGHYDVTLRGAPGRMNWSLPQQSVKVEVATGKQATADFAVKETTLAPTYVGGMTYDKGWVDKVDEDPSPIAKIDTYNNIFPPGPGRDVLERTCMGCHTVQLFAYNATRTYANGRPLHDKDGWAITVDRMHKGVAFNARGKPSNFDPALLPPKDREIVIDYLAKNFGPEAPVRAVQQESDPVVDEKALAKAQFVEYVVPATKEVPKRATHTIAFNTDGTLWTLDRGGSLIWIDPRTAEVKDFPGFGGGESIVADKDGTAWYGGLRHFDPKTKKFDEYKFDDGKTGRNIGVSTPMFDSNGDLWITQLGTGGIGKWDRKTDKVTWWDVPILRSRPYGMTIDRNDKMWFAQYHNSAIASFDPKTQKFRNYPLTAAAPTNIRRVGADSKNFIWAATWGSKGMQNAALYRVNPDTGAVDEHKLEIPYANPYDAAPDDNDNIWVATDNHLVMFDQKTNAFTRYPVTTRTDIARLSITAEGAVWYASRNAGQSGGYGATATALYPDKDAIKTFAAIYSPKSNHSKLLAYKGPMTPVTGAVKLSPAEPQNPKEYAATLGTAAVTGSAGGAAAVLPGGAARE